MLTLSLPLLTPQLHTGPDAEADILTECLALQQLHTSTQLAASDGKGGRALGQELLPGRQAGRQGRGGPFCTQPCRQTAVLREQQGPCGHDLLEAPTPWNFIAQAAYLPRCMFLHTHSSVTHHCLWDEAQAPPRPPGA